MNQPVSRMQVDAVLEDCARCQKAVATALLQGEPDLLAAAAAELQAVTQTLVLALQAVSRDAATSPSLRSRLLQVAQTLGMHREACLRRASVVQRALHSILPTATGTATYGSGTGLYGNQARQSGAFKVLSA